MPAADIKNPTDNDPFLSKREVLALLPICPTTLWTWVRKGVFPPPHKLGNKSVWRRSVVVNHMQTRPLRQYKKLEPQTIPLRPARTELRKD